MAKGSLNFVELHIEKMVLGLAGASLLGMLGYYLFLSPNRVDYEGQKVGPNELSGAILASADDLDRRVKGVKPKESVIPQYADQLAKQLRGTFVGDLGLPAELRSAVLFGQPLPLLEGAEEARNLALVTPLKPTDLRVRTGRSVVRQVAAVLEAKPGERGGAAPRGGDDRTPTTETAWVTVGGYFSLDTQQAEMTKAGYEGHRSKPYITGIDVQRQEVLASGVTSEWQDVPPSKAMPQPKLPEPAIDAQKNELLNRSELDQAYNMLSPPYSQQRIAQPAFYPVTAGDEWQMPPLVGYDVEEELETGAPRKPTAPRTPTPRPPPAKPREDDPEKPTAGGGVPEPEPDPDNPGRPQARDPRERDSRDTVERRRDVRKALEDAEAALKSRKWTEAIRLAEAVIGNDAALRKQKTEAEDVIRRAEAGREREERQKRAADEGAITRPDRPNDFAIWFHDDSVQSGKTYRYRMRVRLWNRYVGRLGAVKDAAMARQSQLVGDWSLPSDPVQVAPSSHFFVTGAGTGAAEGSARVDVFKWNKGDWVKRSYTVAVGDTIGRPEGRGDDAFDFSTGAVVLDIRTDTNVKVRQLAGKKGEFKYVEKPQSVTIVYVDPVDGQVREKTLVHDAVDAIFSNLKKTAKS